MIILKNTFFAFTLILDIVNFGFQNAYLRKFRVWIESLCLLFYIFGIFQMINLFCKSDDINKSNEKVIY